MLYYFFITCNICKDGSAEPRPKNSPPDCFCLTPFGTSFSNPSFSNHKNKSIAYAMLYYFFITCNICRDGSAKPRPKNSPLDCFCLTLFGTSFSNPSFPKHKNKSIAYAMDLFLWWAEMDSNHRTQMRTDLQSAAFSHSAIYPNVFLSKQHCYYKLFLFICQ